MSDVIAKNSIEISVDGSGVDAGIAKIDKSIKNLGKSVQNVGKDASKNLSDIGNGGAAAAGSVDKSTKQIIQSIQRQTAALKAGARGTAEYYESFAALKGANLDAIRPYITQLKEAQTQAAGLAESNKRLKSSIADVANQSSATRGVIAGLGDEVGLYAKRFVGAYALIGAGKAILSASDDLTKLNGQLKNATGSQLEFTQAFSNVQSIAAKSQTDIGAIGSVYARLSNALREVGATQAQVSDVTETLALALKVNGATAEETASVMLQLSQAFGIGKLQGDEFKSAMEAAPNVMRELAKSLNVPFGSLKELASQGQLTSDVLLKAFSNPTLLASLNQQAQGMKSLGGSLTGAKNELSLFAGTVAGSLGVTNGFATAIDFVTSNFAALNRQISGAKTGIDALFPSYQKFIAAENARNGIESSAINTNGKLIIPTGEKVQPSNNLLIPKGAKAGEFFGLDRVLTPGIAITDEEVKKINAGKVAYSALTGEIKLYSQELAKQETIKKNAQASLDANLISQADYNKVIADANDKIKSLNAEKSKQAKISGDVRAQLKIESDAAKNLANSYADILQKATALTAPQETQAQQLQRLLDGYTSLDKGVRDYAQAQIFAAENNEFEARLLADAQAIDEQLSAIQKQAIAIEDENASYGKLPSIIQEVTIARLRDKKATLEGLGLGTEEIERQIVAYERLKNALAGKEAIEAETKRTEAAKKASDEMIKEAKRASDEINRSITDALFRGFESGQSFAKNFKQTLINTFKTLVLRPVVSFLVDSSGITKILSSLGGALGSSAASAANIAPGETTGGLGSLLSSGGTSLFDLIKSGNNSIVGGLESLGASIATGNGGILDSIGGFIGGNAGTISNVLPFSGSALSLLQGDIKGAVGSALGAALSFTPLGPVGGIVGSFVGKALGGLFGGGAPLRNYANAKASFQNGEVFDVKTQSRRDGNKVLSSLTNVNDVFLKRFGGFLGEFGLNPLISTRADFSTRPTKKTTAGFGGTIDGTGFGVTGLRYGKKDKEAFQKYLETVMGEATVSAIKTSSLSANIKSLFDGVTKSEDVNNLINASISLAQNQDILAKKFSLTADSAALVAKTQGDVIGTINSIVSAASSMATAGEQIIKARENVISTLGVFPTTLKGFDNILKGIDASTADGAARFSDVFAKRSAFSTALNATETIKSGVSNALFDSFSLDRQQKFLDDQLSKAFGELNLSVPNTVEQLINMADAIDYTTAAGLDFANALPNLVELLKKSKEQALVSEADLSQNNFRTVVDLQRYRAARSALGAQAANANVNDMGTQIVSNAELAALLKQMVAALNSTANNTKVTSAHLYEVIAGNSTMKVSNS